MAQSLPLGQLHSKQTSLILVCVKTWKLSFDHIRYFQAGSVGIENVQNQDNRVLFNVWLQLMQDKDYVIVPANCELTVQVGR